MATKKITNNYTDNVKFQELMIEHLEKTRLNPNHKTSNQIGEIFLKIANNFLNHRYFIGYPQAVKEEMFEAGIYDCVRSVNNYDPTQYSNPFAYFTQICYFAFRRVIKKERKRLDCLDRYKKEVYCINDIQNTWDDNNLIVDELWREE